MPRGAGGLQDRVGRLGIENPRAMTVAPNGDLFVALSDRWQQVEVLARRGGQRTRGRGSASLPNGLNRAVRHRLLSAGRQPRVDLHRQDRQRDAVILTRSGDLEASRRAGGDRAERCRPSGHWTRDIVFSPTERRCTSRSGRESNVAEEMGEAPKATSMRCCRHPPGCDLGRRGEARRRAGVRSGRQRTSGTSRPACATARAWRMQPETGDAMVRRQRARRARRQHPVRLCDVGQGGRLLWLALVLYRRQRGSALEGRRHARSRGPGDGPRRAVPGAFGAAQRRVLRQRCVGRRATRATPSLRMHGSWNRGTRTGYKVVRLDSRSGKATGDYQDFVTGFVIDDANVWGRPVGVAVGHDGSCSSPRTAAGRSGG